MGDDGIGLTPFFEAMETNFPLSGVRATLSKTVGAKTLGALERAGLLTFLRVSDTYPCPTPGGPGCPRQVVHYSDSDRITAVCGNEPPECEDVELTQKDIEVIGVDPQRLCGALRGPLLFGGKTENLLGQPQVLRAGTYQPRPGIRKAVYFAAQRSAGEYAILLDLLGSRHGGEGFALLVPTDRFVSEKTIRESVTRGVVVLPLSEIIGMDASGDLVAKFDAAELFAGVGRMGPGPIVPSGTVYAQVLTQEGWENLDEKRYRDLLGNADQYDILSDELTREVRRRDAKKSSGKKRSGKPSRPVPASYFQVIRNAVETRGYFDPVVVEEKDSGKQIFQRARAAFDIKKAGDDGNTGWMIFKTVKVDNRSVYQFQPDTKVAFALIFLPKF